MAKQKRDAKATKENIIQNAMYLFSENGFDGTTIDDIAKKSSINKAMIFYYFKNKAGLYEVIMSDTLHAIYKAIVEAKKCCENPLGDLQMFIKTYTLYCQKYPYLPALMLRELSDGGKHLPEMMFAGMRQLFTLLSDILKRGESEGYFSENIPMVIHFMITGTLNLLFVTKELRVKADSVGVDLDTCSTCSMDEISDYIFEKIKRMLEVNDEKDIACT